jgi:hypothetical protein
MEAIEPRAADDRVDLDLVSLAHLFLPLFVFVWFGPG